MTIVRFVALLAAVVTLQSCSRLSVIDIANSYGQVITITYASYERDGPDVATTGWPLERDPTIPVGGSYRLAISREAPDWRMEIQAGDCRMLFVVPGEPRDAFERPEWQIFLAYREAAFQLEQTGLLYRIPAVAGRGDRLPIVERVAQPQGFPLAPVARKGCPPF